MAVSAAEGRKVVVGLYRDILRLHKSKLPPVMRTLGDRYVREEFKAHKNGKTTPDQWKEFVSQWQLYTKTLHGQLGVENPAEEEWAAQRLSELTPDQRERMERLRQQAGQVKGKEPDG